MNNDFRKKARRRLERRAKGGRGSISTTRNMPLNDILEDPIYARAIDTRADQQCEAWAMSKQHDCLRHGRESSSSLLFAEHFLCHTAPPPPFSRGEAEAAVASWRTKHACKILEELGRATS